MNQSLLDSIYNKLAAIFHPTVLSQLLVDLIGKVVVSITVLTIFYFLWLILHYTLNITVKSKIDSTSFSFFNTVVKFIVFCIAIITALDSTGIKTSAILASLGVVGLTIGFAAKDALSNLISGVLIYLDRPFVLGDLVEVENTYGRVARITLRSTRVVTPDGKMLAVPNTEIINKTVISYTNFPHLRLDIQVTIAPDQDIENVRLILFNLIKSDPDFLMNREPELVVKNLNDYNIEIELQAWLENEKIHMEKRFQLREQVFKALIENNIDMPYETIQLRPVQVEIQRSSS